MFDRGEVPAGSRAGATVDVEFDELWVRGRRRGADGKKERIALMHALACEGKATEERGRAVLQSRRVHVAVGQGTASIGKALAAFAAGWDCSRVGQCTVGGDGARWIRKVLAYLPQAAYCLDPSTSSARRGVGSGWRGSQAAAGGGQAVERVGDNPNAARRWARGEARDRVRELAE